MGFVPNLLNMLRGKAGGSQMSPAQQKSQARVDDYRSKGWAADDTIDMDLWNKQAGVQGGTGPPSPEQQGQMFGQGGDAKKMMGSIWDQIKGAPGKIKEGITNLDKKMESNYEASGWGGEDYKNPYADPVEPKEELTYSSTGEDIDNSGVPIPEAVDKVVAAQKTKEGQEFKANMNKYQDEGNYVVGSAINQSMGGMGGGMLGGVLNRMFQKPWDYEVKSKHKYIKPKN